MKSIYEFLLSEHLLKSKTITSIQGHDYVDLGLPSGLLWAKCNIGAYEPYEYGDYFMWGSTEPNTNDKCVLANCPFNDSNDAYDEKYFKSIRDKVCPNGILAPEYDAAAVILEDDWRLPTEDEFQELIDNTKQEWVKNYQGSKIKGMLFKANGNEIFIPASGYRSGSNFWDQGTRANLWSSSLYAISQMFAKYLYFCYNYAGGSIHYSNRFLGFCLRGVKNKMKE